MAYSQITISHNVCKNNTFVKKRHPKIWAQWIFTHTLYVKTFKAGKSFVDFIDEYSSTKLFLWKYLCIVLGDTEFLKWRYNMRKISRYNYYHDIPFMWYSKLNVYIITPLIGFKLPAAPFWIRFVIFVSLLLTSKQICRNL